MHGLVSLLDQKHYSLVEDIWDELESDCGLRGIHVTPLPHFSWQIAEDYDWAAVKKTLEDIAAITKPFVVNTTGLGLFTGENPVVYIPLARTRELSTFHQMIWERIASVNTKPSPYYHPIFWMPHISLAYGDINYENINCLMKKLAFRTFNWEIEINNLTLIFEPEGTIGQMRDKYLFGKEEIG